MSKATRLWIIFKAWFARIALIIIVVCLILVFYHVLEITSPVLIGVFAVLVCGLYELVFETKMSVEELIEGRESKLSPRLYALYECKHEFEKLLDGLRPQSRVTVDHFGLDMSQAWEYINDLMSKKSHVVDFNFRILILTDAATQGECWPKEVRDWSAHVPKALETMGNDLQKLRAKISKSGRRLKVEVRKYRSCPVIHGWALREPLRICYVSFCRWDGESYEDYDWGGERYMRISDDNRSAMSEDISVVFDSYFEHCWIASKEEVTSLTFDSNL